MLAAERIDEAIIDPELLAAHEALNRLLFERDDQQHYLASYRTAINDRPLARALANQGHSTEALTQFRAAVDAAPREVEGRRDLARMLLLLDDFAPAMEQVNAALAIAPYDQEATAFLGLCWRLLGDERETQLNNYSDLVGTYRIPVPEGYTDLDTFMFHGTVPFDLQQMRTTNAFEVVPGAK